MNCPQCQSPSPEGARFCGDCGTHFGLTCPTCRNPVALGKRFCHSCGALLTDSSGHTSPGSYTPKHLADRILTSRNAIEGERKQVTVLFADLKSSMEMIVDRDPEEARQLIDPVLELMMEAVHRYEGTVNQVMGDGIMALFGAPLAHEDHASRACYAALMMQSAIRRYTEHVRRSHGIEVQARIGLNSGEVVVRTIGNDLHMDYSAIGQTTHLAARMEQLAIPGSIRLTADTLHLAAGSIEVRAMGPVPVKGLSAPVDVFELVGPSLARTRMQALAARGLTRFVGRPSELRALARALQRAGAGHGEVVALVGEPGVGKSRLIWEFTHSDSTTGWYQLESGSVSYGRTAAYRPVIDLLKAYLQIEDRDDWRKIREKLTGKLLTLDKALEPMLPPLLTLLDVPIEDPGWQALDPAQRRQRTLDACLRLVLRESQVQPLLLIFEDLQWIDTETQAFLDSLVEKIPAARILLIVNYRPEYHQTWGSKTYYSQLRVDPLPPEYAEELLQTILGEDSSLHAFRHLLIERTEGNPLFIEESIRTLVETHLLTGERGAFRLTKDVTNIDVAPTVQAVLTARIDRLPPDEKRLLQSAAVIGKDLPLAVLQAIADVSEEELRLSLKHLQAAEFLYETSVPPESEYTFKHALTHDVALSSVLHGRRQVLHARVMEAIELLYRDRLPEHVERLGYHALHGEVWEKAVLYLRQAGAKAFARSANREAVAWFEQALAALTRLPESSEGREQAIDIRFDLRSSLLPLGEFGRILDYLREAQDLAGELADRSRLGRVCAYLTDYFRQVGAHERAIESGQVALSVAKENGDLGLEVATNIYLGHVHFDLGQYRRGGDFLAKNVDCLEGKLSRERFGLPYIASVHSRTWLALCLAELGEFRQAIATAQEALSNAELADHPSSLTSACAGLGRTFLRKGDVVRAIPILERGVKLARVWNIRLLFPFLGEALGSAYVLSGRASEGLPLLKEALELHASMRGTAGQAIRFSSLSQACLLTGLTNEAMQVASQALALAGKHGERGHEAYALYHLGEAAAALDPPEAEKAETSYREAIALTEELSMRPLRARCHLSLAALYGRIGRREAAATLMATAMSEVQEMAILLPSTVGDGESGTFHARPSV